MTLPIVASLWIGGKLSFIEQVCLKSFADHGHRTILYTYGEVGGVPPGVEVLDANLIFPNQKFIRHKRSGSPAVHADAFRYRMIELQTVIWVDADVLCMQPWAMPSQFVFGWEKEGRLVCNAVLGLPRFSRTLKRLNTFCRDEYPIPPWAKPEEAARLEAAKAAGAPVHVSELAWGVWGPAAVTHFLFETGEMDKVMPQNAFYPIPFQDRRDLLNPGKDIDARLGAGCYGVHLWNRRLRRRIVTHENGIPAEDSFLGRALIRHDIDPNLAMIPDEPPAHLSEDDTPAPAASASAPVAKPKAKPAAKTQPVVALQQSAEVQHSIDNLEARTAQLADDLPPPTRQTARDSILVVTGMKNEAPFILEWIAYHKAIGVDHFLVYTNDCTDNTNAILDRLATTGLVTRRDNPWDPATGEKPQHAALKDASSQQCYRDADWVLTIDVDEFVNIHVGDGTFPAFLEAAAHPNVVSFTWKFFGSREASFDPSPVTAQFTRCAPEFIPKPRLGWGFKSMVHKSAPYGRIGVHRPLDPDEDRLSEIRWVNGSGRAMPQMLHTNNGWRSTKRSLGYRLATLNHYVLRSADSFLIKRERGRINHTDQDQGVEYWERRNYTSEVDPRMLERQPMLMAEMDKLLADPVLARLHQDAIAWHRARIAHLKALPEYRAIHDAITDPSRPDALEIAKEDEPADPELPSLGKAPALRAPLRYHAPSTASPTPIDPRFSPARAHAEASGGFFWEGAENALMFAPKSRRLVVTLDNLSQVKMDEPRWPWGFKVLTRDMEASVLGVMATKRNWFRHDFVHDAFDALRDQGFFAQFDEILFYGASMGAFGALVFSQCAPGAHVLAIAPQSTLDPAVLPDDRWGWTRKLDWSGRYADAAGALQTAGQVYVVSDPYFDADRAHVERLSAPNMTMLRTPFMQHQLPNALAKMDMLKPLLMAAVQGKLEPAHFYRLFRARRDLPRFQHDLLMEAERRGKTRLAIRVCEYALKRRTATNIERSLERLRGLEAAQ